MNFKKLSRQEKEDLYIKEMTKLQVWWKNPLDGGWNYIKEYSDEKLEKSITDTVGQLRFEKGLQAIKRVVLIVFGVFVFLGIIGLLLFGLRQL